MTRPANPPRRHGGAIAQAADSPAGFGGAVVLATADDTIRTRIRRCAAETGVYLADYHDIGPVRHGQHTALLLLGADLAATAASHASSPASRTVVIAARRADDDVFATAAALHATLISMRSGDVAWLNDQLRTAAAAVLDRLTGAGFRIGYTDHDLGRRFGHLPAIEVSRWRQHERQAVHVSLEAIARDAATAGQSSTVERSNYRTLRRRYPDLWTDLRSADGTALGAFVTDLPPDVVDVLCRLRQDHPVLDEADLADLERRDVRASWRQTARVDVYRMLGGTSRQVCDGLDSRTVDRLWWAVVGGTGAWPDHDGHQVHWDYRRLVPAFAAALMSARRHTRLPNRQYTINQVGPRGRGRARWQVICTGSVVAVTADRHAACFAAWIHHRSTRPRTTRDPARTPAPS
ncbi:hypothetical protein ACQP2P_15980 [Dactylosporangium sp. CA-139114]|uniref:hypothetical protein n=1 Tax=Dactylosporangium sp. CA-139114 TaxID=3239931 RepID=UPI003D977D61